MPFATGSGESGLTRPPQIFGMLGDPLRWRLMIELGRSDRRVGELVEAVRKPQSLVSYHLGELRRAGVVAARRSSADGRDIYYRADLLRCRELLRDAGSGVHPALSLAAGQAADADPRQHRPRLLFLCTGNSARSQIAQALVEHLSGGAVHARSAGSHPKPLHPNAVRVMSERGIDISDRPSTPLARIARRRFERIITLCDKVREVCPDFPGSPATSHWSIADPAAAGGSNEATYPAFQHVAAEIEDRVTLLLSELGAHPMERTSSA